ncbi:MAG: 1-deoxy-D-xylulose-5-phosphate synthase [Alcaligenaceae bacterium]|nr:1-deoxy-D-xylulose-5-phosphate synthase [Alcaligenaceae bacterium]
MQLLDQIQTPADLDELTLDQLETLSKELHAFLLETVSTTGGHLSSNLGTIELTLALHKVFDLPNDKLIWDVGHQAYAHKILTGRKDRMGTLRQKNGLSGFPKRTESEYDEFGTGHSSTSVSAALGMAIAAQYLGLNDRQHIAVIGDGAMTGGMVFEAMNHAGDLKDINLLVILNDNEMSISKPVGALNRHLLQLSSAGFYKNAKEIAYRMPAPLVNFTRKIKDQIKSLVEPQGILFETLGFNYYGPIDGHDLSTLMPALEHVRSLGGLQFLHVVTKKGHGYKLAENNSVLYHGVGRFDVSQGVDTKEGALNYTQVFSHWIETMAQQDTQLMAITPAMKEGSGLVNFAKNFPDRFFDVSIAEQHSVTFAAGLACDQLKPVVAIYSTFLQRAYDQLIHDVALQNLDVTFAIDRAGLVGPDGATHAGNYDIAYLRCIPNMVIATPSDAQEMMGVLTTCYDHNGPAAVRYPRTKAGINDLTDLSLEALPMKAKMVREGRSGLAILVFGPLLQMLHSLSDEMDATLIDMRFVKPLDEDMLKSLLVQHTRFVTVEDSAVEGGAGQAVASYFNQLGVYPQIRHIGLPDQFIHQGDRDLLMSECGLDEKGLRATIQPMFS